MNLFVLGAAMPPFVHGFHTLLNDLAHWMIYLVPVALFCILVITGFHLLKANDAHDIKEIKGKGGRWLFGVGLIGSATWLSSYLWGLFS